MLIPRREKGLQQLTPDEAAEVMQYLRQVDADPTKQMIEHEWIAYITSLAWQEVQGIVSAKERQAFERLSKGEAPDSVAQALGLSVSSVYVYKKRTQDRLRAAIVRLNTKLD
jgi:DNA-binding CsgD family transcriptional regulator